MIAQVASLSTPPSPEEGRVAYNTLISQIQYIMYKNRFKGFTLIELLVVIAIIGILSAVVLASLNSARDKGTDAAIKSNLQSVRSQAELVATNSPSGSYAGVCADGQVVAQVTAAAAGTGATTNFTLSTAQISTSATCHSSAAGYAASAPVKAGGFWCVDSTGASKPEIVTNVLAASAVTCP